jgi:hypothetical protein
MSIVRNAVATPVYRLLPNWLQKFSRYQYPWVTTTRKLSSDGSGGQI